MKMRVAIDFDGCISNYIPFDSEDGGVGKYGVPVEGAAECINKLFANGVYIIIWTSRGHHEKKYIEQYLKNNRIEFDYVATKINIEIECDIEKYDRTDVPRKINADVYIDDKGLRFNGIWSDDFYYEIVNFRPWWKKETKTQHNKRLKSDRERIDSFEVALAERMQEAERMQKECVDKLCQGLNYQEGYNKVIEEITLTRINKCHKYGEDRYGVDDDEFNYWMCFSDVFRKHIRIKQLTKLAIKGDEEAHDSLRDAYADLANYGIMGVQILDQIKDKK